jgi:hypothetical protein
MSTRALILAQIEAIKNQNLVLTRRLRRADEYAHVMEQDRADIHEALAQNRRLIEELEKHL